MKYHTTNKQLRNYYGNQNIIAVGYCDLQYLFYYTNADAYTCGVYGWNADIYEVDGVAICTGYRPIGTHTDYDLVRAYDQKAQKVIYDRRIKKHDTKVNKLEELQRQFVREVKGWN